MCPRAILHVVLNVRRSSTKSVNSFPSNYNRNWRQTTPATDLRRGRFPGGRPSATNLDDADADTDTTILLWTNLLNGHRTTALDFIFLWPTPILGTGASAEAQGRSTQERPILGADWGSSKLGRIQLQGWVLFSGDVLLGSFGACLLTYLDRGRRRQHVGINNNRNLEKTMTSIKIYYDINWQKISGLETKGTKPKRLLREDNVQRQDILRYKLAEDSGFGKNRTRPKILTGTACRHTGRRFRIREENDQAQDIDWHRPSTCVLQDYLEKTMTSIKIYYDINWQKTPDPRRKGPDPRYRLALPDDMCASTGRRFRIREENDQTQGIDWHCPSTCVLHRCAETILEKTMTSIKIYYDINWQKT
ncbi:hypothetical protein GALMADRAFT_206260 [Galerina marginata CBS 339.88]|uniref:Uncharacterized protein n=1 Tax=Galerina marginata (strain CBS 339.88) TaxID=685588 RepID=A0A067TJ50_GALM3|nr:hypothetical protein GALMADRAFT_206260 [Galerina marginata CBS 339.88]